MMQVSHENIPSTWRIARERIIVLDQPCLIGILNVTPDSFSDGGVHHGPHSGLGAALRMIEEGASIIDVGGESTRPGAERVPADEQIRRVVPVIEQIRKHSDVLVTIDTTLGAVARAAFDAGADAINDVAAGTEDDGIFTLAAERQCGIILMHRLLRPEQDSFSDQYTSEGDMPHYDDVVVTVRDFLAERARAAIRAGIDPEAIVIDPGLGFGKTVEQNYELIARVDELMQLGYPVLSAASRKSFLGAVSGVARPADRVAGSVAVSVAQWMSGVRLFRVHDVAAHRQALSVAVAAATAAHRARIART
jgi:dihydropteroate synthase